MRYICIWVCWQPGIWACYGHMAVSILIIHKVNIFIWVYRHVCCIWYDMLSVPWLAPRRLGPGWFKLLSAGAAKLRWFMSKTCVPVYLCTPGLNSAAKLQRSRRLSLLQREFTLQCCRDASIDAQAGQGIDRIGDSLLEWQLCFLILPGACCIPWTARSGPW